jgi:acetyltransferase-like isoleucine patch superfamily enzyme
MEREPLRTPSPWQKLLREIDIIGTHWLLQSLNLLGSGRLGDRFRGALLRALGYPIGPGVTLAPGFVIKSRADRFQIGEGTFLNRDVFIDAKSPVTIGCFCDIGFRTMFVTAQHELQSDFERRRPVREGGPIVVEDFVWIGANVTVLPGVTVGAGAVIGAGSVVTKDVPPRTLALGVPARVVRQLQPEESGITAA